MLKKKKEMRAQKGRGAADIIEEEEEDDDYFGDRPKIAKIDDKQPQEEDIPIGKSDCSCLNVVIQMMQ